MKNLEHFRTRDFAAGIRIVLYEKVAYKRLWGTIDLAGLYKLIVAKKLHRDSKVF